MHICMCICVICTGMDNCINELSTAVTSIKHRTFYLWINVGPSYWSSCCSKLIMSWRLNPVFQLHIYTCAYRLSHCQLSTYTDYPCIWCFLTLYNNNIVHVSNAYILVHVFMHSLYTIGDYRFAVASDDTSEVWLSTDHQAKNLRKICCVGCIDPVSVF